MFRKYQNVFRSRWRAVIWSAGVLLTAYCSVPSADQGKDAGASKEEAAAIAAVLGEPPPGATHPAHRHTNPWAVDEPEQDQSPQD